MIDAIKRAMNKPTTTIEDKRLSEMVMKMLERIKKQDIPKVPLSRIPNTVENYVASEKKILTEPRKAAAAAAAKKAVPKKSVKPAAVVPLAVKKVITNKKIVPKKRIEDPEDNKLWTYKELFTDHQSKRTEHSMFEFLPFDIVFEVMGYLSGSQMIQFVSSCIALPDSIWNTARHTIYSSGGEDIPWPFCSAYEYFRITSLAMIYPTAMNICLYDAPWPISASTLQPFGRYLTPVNPDKLPRGVSREEVDAGIEEFRTTFPERFDAAMKESIR